MKGRNCYAAFWSYPGLEKLFNFIEVKASFLRPVSLPFSGREPFSRIAAAGQAISLRHRLLVSHPAAASLFALHILQCGRRPGTDQLHFPTSDAGRYKEIP